MDRKKKIEKFQTVLDDLVNVNSLFTFAMFIGISFVSANPHSLVSQKECQTSQATRMLLMLDEVVSFVCFLLSSIVATALKMHLSTQLSEIDDHHEPKPGGLPMKGLRSFMITVSVASSVLGCVYLTLSMFNVIRVLLGNITCGDSDTVQAAGALIAINVLALLVYAPSMGYAVFQSHSMLD
ncbi:uncharacterized protein LOC104429843 [Eucalyptus grandis]|uniref:PGG domain-containing protein n=1 Tax=Eucalyptus grandis TaxID=71139 RepID=A0A058ZTS2_EUCGR|nr:uncharacterized protein LOC104429843 [Eucalyptus grandis]KAK2632343.1 hypothetical protein EUGRSUZ_L01675 [Eucalyptus grandis]